MKTNIFRTLLMLFLATSLFTACDSDDEDTVDAKPPTNEELLTSKEWRGDAIFVLGQDPKNFPGAAEFVPDVKTISIKFEQDGTYKAKFTLDGTAYDTTGEWKFTADEKKIEGQFFNLPASEADIALLTDKELRLSTQIIVPNFILPVQTEIRLIR